ncbi:MAG TPA: hypothetical protein VEF03_10240, partial [Candidatus Binataceae bacterium]|nr:hypothetical protein [Candidatus Binataceae bacterium]
MSRITIVTTLRFFAAIAPAILLVVSPVLALGILWLGSAPSAIRDVQVAALEDAQALDTALYKMEWGRTQPDSSQIVLDQERRFADMLDSAARVAVSQEQRDRIRALASASKPTLDALRQANPRDDSLDPKMRELHAMVTDLITAGDTALMQAADDARTQARRFAIVA